MITGFITEIEINNEEIEPEVSDDVKEIYEQDIDGVEGEQFKPNDEENMEIQKLGNILKKLRNDLANKFERRQKRGKVDIRSVLQAKQNKDLKIFKQQSMSMLNKTKLAVSIVLDSSGSVKSPMFEREMKGTYIITKALENIKNKCMVVEFSSDYRIMKDFNSSGDWTRKYHNRTHVAEPLKLSMNKLLAIKKKENIPNLLNIVFSDGGFDDRNEAKKVIEEMKKKGIYTVWIYCGGYDNIKQFVGDCGFDKFVQVKEVSKLSKAFEEVVIDVQNNIKNKIMRGR